MQIPLSVNVHSSQVLSKLVTSSFEARHIFNRTGFSDCIFISFTCGGKLPPGVPGGGPGNLLAAAGEYGNSIF
jgi:hypothetical protein